MVKTSQVAVEKYFLHPIGAFDARANTRSSVVLYSLYCFRCQFQRASEEVSRGRRTVTCSISMGLAAIKAQDTEHPFILWKVDAAVEAADHGVRFGIGLCRLFTGCLGVTDTAALPKPNAQKKHQQEDRYFHAVPRSSKTSKTKREPTYASKSSPAPM